MGGVSHSGQVCQRCGTASPDGSACFTCLLADDVPPVEIPGVVIHNRLGKGGMGEVFLGHHTGLGRQVAVKLLSPELLDEPTSRGRFSREARLAGRLSHPNVAVVFDFGESAGIPYLIMEYVDGKPLSGILPLPLKEVARIGMEICDALEAAHELGIVHRDVKPSNVLIRDDGHIKVVDFGIARLEENSGELTLGTNLTASHMVLGTPYYTAPEAFQGAPAERRMDIYSLGALLYKCATGNVPVGSFDPLPGGLDAIVRKALSPDPTRRQGSVAEIRESLAALARGEAPVVDATTTERVSSEATTRAEGTKAPSPPRQGRLATVLGLAGLTIAAALVGVQVVPLLRGGQGLQISRNAADVVKDPAPQAELTATSAPADGEPVATAPPDGGSTNPETKISAAPVGPKKTTGRRTASGNKRTKRPPRRKAARPVPTPVIAATPVPAQTPVVAVPQTGQVLVRVQPWAMARVDQSPKTISVEPPSHILELPVGKHTVELWCPATRKRTLKHIEVKAGETLELPVDLR